MASQLLRLRTESGFDATTSIEFPDNFPSRNRPTDLNITCGVPFGMVGSVYATDVAIMLSASNRTAYATLSFAPSAMNFPVESLKVTAVKRVVPLSGGVAGMVPVHLPPTSAGVRAAGAAGVGAVERRQRQRSRSPALPPSRTPRRQVQPAVSIYAWGLWV